MKCLFCGEEKHGWLSLFTLMPMTIQFTVCPRCRPTHSIEAIYVKLAERDAK